MRLGQIKSVRRRCQPRGFGGLRARSSRCRGFRLALSQIQNGSPQPREAMRSRVRHRSVPRRRGGLPARAHQLTRIGKRIGGHDVIDGVSASVVASM